MTTSTFAADIGHDHLSSVDEFIEDVFSASAGVFKIFSMYLGHRLGYYDALAVNASVTSTELSELTRTHERYTREWLEQQAVVGVVEVLDESAGPFDRRYRLPAAHIEVLTDKDSLNYLAPWTQLLAGVVRPLPHLVDAYRSGAGVAYHEYGPDTRQGQAAMNRVAFLELLGKQWIPAMADVHEKLTQSDACRVADFGCGCGWSSIGVAKAYPRVLVDGYDSDAASIDEAQRLAADQGVSGRVTFHCADVSQVRVEGGYDLILLCETLHDMGDPVGALRTARGMLADGGAVLIVDERTAEKFGAAGNDIEWLLYGCSILHCLPVGMADGAERCCGGTGTVMRPSTVRRYAQQSGFCGVEVLPIENFFFRMYRLRL